MVTEFPSSQRSHSESGSAVAAWRSFRVAVWDMCSGSSTPTRSQVAVALSLPGKQCEAGPAGFCLLRLWGTVPFDTQDPKLRNGAAASVQDGIPARKAAVSVCSTTVVLAGEQLCPLKVLSMV